MSADFVSGFLVGFGTAILVAVFVVSEINKNCGPRF